MIQRANRRLCVLPVYTASDLWGCCMQPKQRLWPPFPHFSAPLSIRRRWGENLFNSRCNNSRPVSNRVCKNRARVCWCTREAGFYTCHNTNRDRGGGEEFKTIYNVCFFNLIILIDAVNYIYLWKRQITGNGTGRKTGKYEGWIQGWAETHSQSWKNRNRL